MKYLIGILFIGFGCNSKGTVPLGENGDGVLLCDEAIVLNATDDVLDGELRSMLTEALLKRKMVCRNLK